MKDWLADNDGALPVWVRHTKVPLLATLPDGSILWANAAMERLLDYTVSELLEMTWTELTAASNDADKDAQMAAMLVDGSTGRVSYEFRKSYRKKNGEMVPVVIDVIRYPLHGGEESFKAFLVSVMPIESSAQFAIKEVHALRDQLVEFMTKIEERREVSQKEPLSDRLLKWATDNPTKAGVILAFLAFLLFGDRVLEILQEIRGLFIPGATGANE